MNSKEQLLFFVLLFLIFYWVVQRSCNHTDISHVLIYLCFTAVVFELALKVNGAICITGKGVQKSLQISNILEKRNRENYSCNAIDFCLPIKQLFQCILYL